MTAMSSIVSHAVGFFTFTHTPGGYLPGGTCSASGVLSHPTWMSVGGYPWREVNASDSWKLMSRAMGPSADFPELIPLTDSPEVCNSMWNLNSGWLLRNIAVSFAM